MEAPNDFNEWINKIANSNSYPLEAPAVIIEDIGYWPVQRHSVHGAA